MKENEEFDELIRIYYESWFRMNAMYHVWAKKHGIQDSVLFALYIIKEASPNCTQNELCERLLFPKQTVSLILAELEKKGYVTRESNPADRRNKIVRFTESGSQYAGVILGQLKAAEIEVFRNLAPAQRRSMIESLDEFARLLAKSFQ